MVGADFFTTEVLTSKGLLTYYSFFAIDLQTRTVHICGTTLQPHGQWMNNIARNLTDCFSGFLKDKPTSSEIETLLRTSSVPRGVKALVGTSYLLTHIIFLAWRVSAERETPAVHQLTGTMLDCHATLAMTKTICKVCIYIK